MRLRFQRHGAIWGLLLAVAIGMAAIAFWWLCSRSEEIAFLPKRGGAEWILYPKPPEGTVRSAVPLVGGFRRSLALDTSPAEAVLTLRTFKMAEVFINGHAVAIPPSSTAGWKMSTRVDVAELLHAGTNVMTVWVTNNMGPPALWLHLEMGEASIATDDSWQASLAGAPWKKACLAKDSQTIQPSSLLYGREHMLDSLTRARSTLATLAIITLLFVVTAERMFHRQEQSHSASVWLTPKRLSYMILMFVLVARAALVIHNLPLLPPRMGFDAVAHEDYVGFILKKHALPFAEDGWEMHQPPLYYAVGALVVGTSGCSPGDQETTLILRTINGVIGLIHCWLVFECLRLFFPDNYQAQVAGLLIAAFVPPHLFLSQYVTNEPLVWLLVTLALFLCLRALQGRKHSLWLYLGIGLALGAAMLAKLTALPIIPVIVGALVMHQTLRRNWVMRDWLRNLGMVALSCFSVCGWYYWRSWKHSDMAVLPNWEKDPTTAWWQDPGFHTYADFFHFGQALTTPLYSAFSSVIDGLYTTLWGDGLASGTVRLAFRPPWNYDLMNAAYLLALALSLLVALGFVITTARFFLKPAPTGLLMFGPVALSILGVIYFILHSPWLGAIKAFYILPALAPFCGLAVTSWNWLIGAHRVVCIGLWTILIIWATTVYAAFWVHEDDPQTHLVRGLSQMEFHKDAEAFESLSRALQMNEKASSLFRAKLPQVVEADAYFSLGLILDGQGKSSEAVLQYRHALRVKEDFVGAANNLAWILASSPKEELRNGPEAVELAERACELTKYQTPVFIGTLAAAYAEAGRFPEAVATAERARDLARENMNDEVARRNEELIKLYQSGKPFREN